MQQSLRHYNLQKTEKIGTKLQLSGSVAEVRVKKASKISSLRIFPIPKVGTVITAKNFKLFLP